MVLDSCSMSLDERPFHITLEVLMGDVVCAGASKVMSLRSLAMTLPGSPNREMAVVPLAMLRLMAV